jgi:hypothetical protein
MSEVWGSRPQRSSAPQERAAANYQVVGLPEVYSQVSRDGIGGMSTQGPIDAVTLHLVI